MKDPVIHVALSRSQIHEILAQLGPRDAREPQPLNDARQILRRAVREPKPVNDQEPERKTA